MPGIFVKLELDWQELHSESSPEVLGSELGLGEAQMLQRLGMQGKIPWNASTKTA